MEQEILSCPHVRIGLNPLMSTTPNVAVLENQSLVVVAEGSKTKLVCWACVKKLPIRIN